MPSGTRKNSVRSRGAAWTGIPSGPLRRRRATRERAGSAEAALGARKDGVDDEGAVGSEVPEDDGAPGEEGAPEDEGAPPGGPPVPEGSTGEFGARFEALEVSRAHPA